MAASLAFLNQLWNFDIRPWSNIPYWSISYEFWYYVYFALLLFTRSKWLLVLWGLVVGPAIVLLLPVWLAGVWVYRRSKTFTVSPPVAWAMAVLPVAAYVAYSAVGIREQLTALTDPLVAMTGDPWFLHKARFFAHNYVVTLLLCLHFLGVVVLFRDRKWAIGAAPIKYAAAYTFTVYLLHYPLLYCLTAVFPDQDWLVVAGVALVVWMVGTLCERRKDMLRVVFTRLLLQFARLRFRERRAEAINSTRSAAR